MPLLARPNFLLFSCNGHARKAIAKLWFAVVTLFNLSKILTTRFIYLEGKNHQRDWKLFFYGAKGKKSIAWYVLYSTLLGLYCCKFHSRNWKLSGLYCNKKEDRLLWECCYTITNQTKWWCTSPKCIHTLWAETHFIGLPKIHLLQRYNFANILRWNTFSFTSYGINMQKKTFANKC